MAFNEKIPTPENEELARFREEISELKRIEEQERKTANLTKLHPENLGEQEMNIWKKFQGKTLTKEEYDAYREGVEGRDAIDFVAFIGNKIISWEIWPPEKDRGK